jgi:hypothetical protein
MTIVPIAVNHQLVSQNKNDAYQSAYQKRNITSDLNNAYDMNAVLKNVPVKTKPDLDNYSIGTIEDKTDTTHEKSDIMQGVFLNGLATLELKEGIDTLITPRSDVISVIAKQTDVNKFKLGYTLGNTDALQKIYNNSVQSMGIASVLIGTGGLMRLATHISDGYSQYHKDTQHNNLIRKKQGIIQDFNQIVDDNQTNDSDINTIQKKVVKKLQDITAQELKNNTIAEKHQKINNVINQAADIVSSVGGLVTVKNMVHTLRTPNAIPQAISAFNSGAIATGQTIMAIKMGVGLLAMGMTISSVATMINVAKNYLKSDDNHSDDNSDTHSDEKKIQQHTHANNKIIRESLVTATEQMTSGIGSAILLQSDTGFKIAKLLNWNQSFMFNKMFAWSNAGIMLIGGVNALMNATQKIKDNQNFNAPKQK